MTLPRSFYSFLFLTISCFFLASCSSNPAADEVLEPVDLSGASWIGGLGEWPDVDSLMYLDHPAPLLRKEFTLEKRIKEARITITAAGYYTLWINGEKVGDEELSPAWTNYAKRVYSRTFDVTGMISSGSNVLAVELGNGWYNPLPLRMWGGRNIRKELPTGTPRVILALDLVGSDGNKAQWVSDGSWKCSNGSIVRNNVYLGEWHKDKDEPNGWKESGFEDGQWSNVQTVSSPGGQIVPAFFPPIRKTATLKPVDVWKTKSGTWMVDFGQNTAGKIRYDGPFVAGDTIRFRSGELIYPDSTLNQMTAVAGQIKRAGVGGPGAPPVAEQVDVWIPQAGSSVFEPRYTFHGFRYVEISGIGVENPELIKSGIVAYRMGSYVARIASFTAGVEWVNDIQRMVEWTFLSNIFSVQSDCPAREKFGYGGDLNGTSEAFMCNYDMADFYRKTVYDWKDAMKEDVFVDCVPYVGIQYCGISWESAFLLQQDLLFRYEKDTASIREWYETDREWMAKASRILPVGLVHDGLSDHEALKPVPVELIGTGHYYQCLRVMQKFSGIMNDHTAQTNYKLAADRLQKIMIDSLYLHPFKPIQNPQTWYSTLLYHHVLPEDLVSDAVDSLIGALKSDNMKLSTGLFGTGYLLEVLSRYGYGQLAYEVVSGEDFPGWRHMLENGATTVWETWKQSDNTFSQDHPMFGSVSAWFHRWLLGIQIPDDSNEVQVLLSPQPIREVGRMEGYRLIGGKKVGVSWEIDGNNVNYVFDIPDGIRARWIQPGREGEKIDINKSGKYRYQMLLNE